MCRSAWWVGRVSAGLPSLGACALFPCPLGVLAPRGVPWSVGWGVVVPSGVLGPILFCPSASLSSPILGVAAVSPSPSGARAVALFGGPCYGRGPRLAVRVWWWVVQCSWPLPVWE